jgi:hypothetical protein
VVAAIPFVHAELELETGVMSEINVPAGVMFFSDEW